jgi:hypothetical protein
VASRYPIVEIMSIKKHRFPRLETDLSYENKYLIFNVFAQGFINQFFGTYMLPKKEVGCENEYGPENHAGH